VIAPAAGFKSGSADLIRADRSSIEWSRPDRHVGLEADASNDRITALHPHRAPSHLGLCRDLWPFRPNLPIAPSLQCAWRAYAIEQDAMTFGVIIVQHHPAIELFPRP
jgi:hypothetical protein